MSKKKQAVNQFSAPWILWLVLGCGIAHAHGVASGDQSFLANAEGIHVFPYMYQGAKHMVGAKRTF